MSRGRPRPKAREAREFLWEWIDEKYPEFWDMPDHPGLADPALWQEARDFLQSRRYLTQVETIGHWLTHADQFSPFADPIAIERAVNLDFEVFQNMSDYEKSIAVDLLAAETNLTGRSNGAQTEDPKRVQAWDELPEAHRSMLATIVSKRRQRLRGRGIPRPKQHGNHHTEGL